MSKVYTREQVIKLIQEHNPGKFEDFVARNTSTEFTQAQVDVILGK